MAKTPMMPRFLSRHNLSVWLCLAFLAPLLVIAVLRLQFSNAVEKWLPHDSPEARTFEWYQDVFGREEFALVTWEGSALDAEQEYSRLEFLARRLEALPEIARCQTPGRLIKQMTDVGVARDEAIRRLEGVLIGPGRDTAGIAVVLSEEGRNDREAAINVIRNTASDAAGVRYHQTDPSKNELHLGGAPVANAELDVWSRDSLGRLLPLSTGVCIILTLVSLRSLRLGVLVLITAYYSVLATMALIAVTGGSLNLLMVIIPSLVMVVGLSGSIHFVNYWRFAQRGGGEGSVARAWSMAWQPCVFACVTTAIGLGSLATSRITPVRQFGIFAGLGVLVTLGLVLVALPAGLQFLRSRKRAGSSGSDEFSAGAVDLRKNSPAPGRESALWRDYGMWLSARAIPLTTVCLVVFALGSFGLVRSRTEIRPIRYFPDDSRIVQDYQWIEDNLGGLVPVETVIRFTGQEDQMDLLKRLNLVREIEKEIRDLPEVAGTLSLASLTPEFDIGEDPFGIKRSAVKLSLQNGLETNKARLRTLFVDSDEADGEQLWRITALTKSLENVDYAALVGKIESSVAGAIRDFGEHPGAPDVLKTELTGLVPLVMHAQNEVLRGLKISFAVAFGIIGLVIVVLLRSPAAGVVAMVPNLAPVAAVFGILGWTGVPIDIGTMMTASVALGIAVDGTLHLLTWFNRGIRDGMSRSEAVGLSLQQAGPAIVKTSLIAGLCMLVLGASPFLPTQRFGMLMSGLLGASMLGGIMLLPALLASPVGMLLERTVRVDPSAAAPREKRRDAGQSVVRPAAEFQIDQPPKPSVVLRTGSPYQPEN